jgi:Domain of unknown function (DUF4476)
LVYLQHQFLIFNQMKKSIVFLVMLWSSQLLAQSALTVFAEEGEKFTIFLNSIQQNKVPQSNVRVEDIKDNVQKVRIVFEDKSIPVLNDNAYYEPSKEYTYMVKKKNTAANKVKRIDGKSVGAVYVLRLQDVKSWGSKINQSGEVVVADDGSGTIGTTTDNVSTTTITDISNQNQGENININVGVNGAGINMNITDLGAVNNSTTTTTKSTSVKISNKTVVSGSKDVAKPATKIVCAPMSANTLGSVVAQIKKQSFEDNKVNIVKQALASNCISASQVKKLMGEFSFEENKLKIAKMCYAKTTDKNNYFTLNDAFSFSSSADELHTFLESKGAVVDGE